jgi:hypothetical protein
LVTVAMVILPSKYLFAVCWGLAERLKGIRAAGRRRRRSHTTLEVCVECRINRLFFYYW